jgi:filamentous hemagglutinin family protein
MKPKFLLSLLILASLVVGPQTAIAQQIPTAQPYIPSNRAPVSDNTLGTQVSGTGTFDITGGVTRGQTLFHSFSDFSVPTSGQANFLNPVGNRDIITRVTGNVFSDINGLVNTNGANFFLINPNGIVFGPSATLNVGKAFVGSTANSIDLVGGGQTITFRTNPNGDAPLLSIAPNVLFDVSRLNLGGGTGAISNFGTLQTTNPNQYIGLIGGNVNINGGQINAPGGRVDLGGLSAPGTVSLVADVNNLRAQFPTNVARGDVSLINGARVTVRGAGGGDVEINARNVEISGASGVRGGISSGLGTSATVAGDLKVNATEDVRLADSSVISNEVEKGAVGKGGGVEISSRNLSVTNVSALNAFTAGQGDAGTIKITAMGDVLFDGSKDGFGSGAFSTVDEGAVGKGGRVEISARNLSVTNGAGVQALSRGQGDAGTIKINTTEDVLFDGRKDSFNSQAFSTVEQGAVGNGGEIEINSRNLSVANGAALQASNKGQGNAGNIKITVTDNASFNGGDAFSTLGQGVVGKGGGVEINARNLSVTNGAQLTASTKGQGNAGTVKITATGDVLFDGRKDSSTSGVLSTVEKNAVGNGGEIEINSRNLSVTNGAQLTASTKGQGDAGNIKITAMGDVSFNNGSGALSTVEQGAVSKGKGGGVEINARNLSVNNGAQLQALTRGQGDAGNIKITATGDVLFDGRKDGSNSAALSTVEKDAVGNGGEIEINSRNLSVTNGAALSATTQGQEKAGNIILTVNKIRFDQGRIALVSLSSTGGDLIITTTDYLLLRNNSRILTDSGSTAVGGNGGNITINSPLIIAPPGNNDITANAFQGNGGNLNITSQGLFGIKSRIKGQDSLLTNDITASSEFGQQGAVNINTPGTDPGKDSTELPNVTTDASNQISQVCSASNRENKLTVTGRGGLPPNANDPLTSDVVWQDARAANPQPVASSATTNPAKLAAPAVGWVFDGKGKVTLVAAATKGQPTGTSVICPSTR